MNENKVYSTPADILAEYVIPSLGEWADDFDVHAITAAISVQHTVYTENGDIYLNDSGYIVNPDVDFWAIVAEHDLTA